MRSWRRQQGEIEVLEELRCDRCGRTVPSYHDGTERQFVEATPSDVTATFSARWGYGSHRDREHWSAELCQECAADIRQAIDSGAGPGVQVEPTEDHVLANAPEFVASMRQADQDIAAGGVATFQSAEEFVADLDREAAECDARNEKGAVMWRVRVRTYTPGDGYHESVLKTRAETRREAEAIVAQVCFDAGAEIVQIGSIELAAPHLTLSQAEERIALVLHGHLGSLGGSCPSDPQRWLVAFRDGSALSLCCTTHPSGAKAFDAFVAGRSFEEGKPAREFPPLAIYDLNKVTDWPCDGLAYLDQDALLDPSDPRVEEIPGDYRLARLRQPITYDCQPLRRWQRLRGSGDPLAEWELRHPARRLAAAQGSHVGQGRSTDEFIAERRAEAAREETEEQ